MLAHRGLPGPGRPENSVAAVAAALDAGAHGVEVDLRLSADGVLVACHDADLRRAARSGLAVAGTSWAELWAVSALAGVTLARAEDLVRGCAGADLVLEVKPVPDRDRAQRTADSVAALLAGPLGALPRRVTLSSFDARLLALLREAVVGPGRALASTALLGEEAVPWVSLVRRALDDGHTQVHPHLRTVLADPAGVRQAHQAGLEVVPWTVNGRECLRHVLALRVDAVITDAPATALEVAAVALRESAALA